MEEVKVTEKDQDVDKDKEKNLIIHNDETTQFDYVVEALIQVCDHTPEQAEQCTTLAHFKGKCDVKKGSYKDLKNMKSQLIDRGLSATID